MALLDEIRQAQVLNLLGERLQGLLDAPTSAARFMVNPTAVIDAISGKTAMPKEKGFAEGATGLPQRQNLTVLDHANRAYMEGYDLGEPFGYAAGALPIAGSGATKLSDKLVQTITKNPSATAMNVIDYAGQFNPSQIFIGQNSKLWDANRAFKAAKMEKQGKSAEEIWKETGTARGLDNNWRQELSDDKVPMLSYGTAKELNKYPSMENVLGHKELFKGYGDRISKAPVGNDAAEFTKDYYGNPQVGGASYRESTNEYTVSPRPYGATTPDYGKAQKGALLHELQHSVQSIEDWARGGNPKSFTQQKDAELARDILNFRREIDRYSHLKDNDAIEQAIKNDYKKAGITEWIPNQETINLAFDVKGNPSNELQSIVNLYGLDKSTTARTPEQMYNLLAGEAEARATHSRMDLTPEQRLEYFPFKQGKFGIDINPQDALIWNNYSDIYTRDNYLKSLLGE